MENFDELKLTETEAEPRLLEDLQRIGADISDLRRVLAGAIFADAGGSAEAQLATISDRLNVLIAREFYGVDVRESLTGCGGERAERESRTCRECGEVFVVDDGYGHYKDLPYAWECDGFTHCLACLLGVGPNDLPSINEASRDGGGVTVG